MTIIHTASIFELIISPLQYNQFMRGVILTGFLLMAACSPLSATQLTSEPLIPYSTDTPSPTAAQPEGLILSNESALPSSTPFTYTVKPGDTLSKIAEQFGIALDDLQAANPNVSPNSMSVARYSNPSGSGNQTGESTPTPVLLTSEKSHATPPGYAGCGASF